MQAFAATDFLSIYSSKPQLLILETKSA